MKLTDHKFNQTISTMNIRERSREMAYEVLVNNKSCGSVGEKFEVSRQAAHNSALRVWKKYLENIECPPGWTAIELVLPIELANKIKNLEQNELKKYLSLNV